MSDEEIRIRAYELALASYPPGMSTPADILETAKTIYAWLTAPHG